MTIKRIQSGAVALLIALAIAGCATTTQTGAAIGGIGGALLGGGIGSAIVGAAAGAGIGRVGLLVMGNGPPQVSLGAARRPRRGARLRLRRRAARLGLGGRLVILVDDVRTTGASLNAAARLLRRLGPSRVVAGVLAVTEDPARRRAGEAGSS